MIWMRTAFFPASGFLCMLLIATCVTKAGERQTVEPAPADKAITVIVVRHAERDGAVDEDPPLDARGRERAAELARVLADAGVNAIYTTDLRRTRQTARPLAVSIGIAIREVPVDSEDIQRHAHDLAALIRSGHRGGVVVVVGHSNTVPAIVEALSGAAVEPIAHDQYDRLYIVQIPAIGAPRLVRARYGAGHP